MRSPSVHLGLSIEPGDDPNCTLDGRDLAATPGSGARQGSAGLHGEDAAVPQDALATPPNMRLPLVEHAVVVAQEAIRDDNRMLGTDR